MSNSTNDILESEVQSLNSLIAEYEAKSDELLHQRDRLFLIVEVLQKCIDKGTTPPESTDTVDGTGEQLEFDLESSDGDSDSNSAT